jgi:hypothetical protein
MNVSNSLTARIMKVSIFRKIKVFSEWLKLHTAYSRLDHYTHMALSSTERGVAENSRERELTVSLTTYAHRIHNVHLAIESLLRQTIKPNKIFLWLSVDEFTDETIPEILKRQRDRGLQIRYCDDIRSYKKIIPTLVLFPNDIIITADDDIVYPHDHVERLYRAHLKEPDLVHCNRAHYMKVSEDQGVQPYQAWKYESSHPDSSILIFPTSGTGAIYTREYFDEEVGNTAAFSELCPYADDIWLKLMTARRGTKCKLVADARPFNHYLKIPDIYEQGLININRVANDEQLGNVLKRYPDILDILKQKN